MKLAIERPMTVKRFANIAANGEMAHVEAAFHKLPTEARDVCRPLLAKRRGEDLSRFETMRRRSEYARAERCEFRRFG